MNCAARALLASLLAIVAGCASTPPAVGLAPPPAGYGPGDYDHVRERWTREAHVLKALDTTIHVHATYLSPDFSSAYLARRGELFRWSDADRTRAAAELREEGERFHTFFVGVATHDYAWNDLERKGSIWRVVAITERGEQIAPIELRVEKVITATTTELFPYLGPFFRAYRLRFPRQLADGRPLLARGAQRLALLIAGPLGQAELVWRLR